MKGTCSLKYSWQLFILAFEAKTWCKITIFSKFWAHSVSRRISILLLTYFTLLWTLTKKNDIIKQDTFFKNAIIGTSQNLMNIVQEMSFDYNLNRKKISLVVMNFLMTVYNSHHINAWKNYVNWNGLLDFFIGITKRLLLFLANVKRKIYSHIKLQILFQHYHENYLDKITF